MDKETMINELIANGLFAEEDREFLGNKSDEQVAKLHQNAVKPPMVPSKGKKKDEEEEDMEQNAEPETLDSFIAKAPAEMQDVLRSGLQAHTAQKTELVKVITANKANTFSKEVLMAKGLSELQGLARLASSTTEAPKAPAMNFAGMGEPAAPVVNTEEPLAMPTMDFGAK